MLELVIHRPRGRHVALYRADHGRSPVDSAIAIAVDEHHGCFGRAARATSKSAMPDLWVEASVKLDILARALGERERSTLQGFGGCWTQQYWKQKSTSCGQKAADCRNIGLARADQFQFAHDFSPYAVQALPFRPFGSCGRS